MLIGLTGKAGVGKDTVADMLAKHGFQRYGFADPLKQALEVMGLPEPYNREDKESLLPGKDYSWRKAAQTLGTEWARNLDTNFWLELATLKVNVDNLTVISDVRFPNELRWIRNRGGVVWHIVGRSTTTQGAAQAHASESPLPVQVGDYTLYNTDTLERLYADVLLHLQTLKDENK